MSNGASNDLASRLAVFPLLLSLGCASGAPAGQSLADKKIEADTLRVIGRYEQARELNGESDAFHLGQPKVKSAKVVLKPSPTNGGRWQEIWTIDRMGGSTDYLITYTPTPGIGGTDIDVAPAHAPSPSQASQIPPGIPANVQVYFAGKPGHTIPFHDGPPPTEGTFYIYDDTSHQILHQQRVSPQHPDLDQNVKYEMSHNYRGFLAPSR